MTTGQGSMDYRKIDLSKIQNSDDVKILVDALAAATKQEMPGADIPTFLRHVQDILRAPASARLADEEVPSWSWMGQLLVAAFERMKKA